ncbi:MAG: MarR family transcriptional regulator [Gammaproteobacteria bacterium]
MMSEIEVMTKDQPTEQRIQQLAQYFILLRKLQDKSGAELLISLGNLNMQELNVINIIGDNEPCTMSEIAKQAMLSMSSITVIVDKLVKAKLVQRIRSEEDRRIVLGALTPEGKKIHQVQIKHMHEVIRKLLSVLSDDEQENMLKIFHKFTQVLI